MGLNKDQNKLLNIFEEHSILQGKNIFNPGPYWDYKAKKILYYLRKKGLNNFRGFNSGVGTSYCDNKIVDIRNELGQRGRLVSLFFSLPIVKKIFDLQLNLTKENVLENIKLNNIIFNSLGKVKNLINKYQINDSINFGCVSKIKINNLEFSTLYLEMIERIDNLSKIYNLNKINSFIEIGGGFGANIHLLIQNFPNIKKIIYADIFPNIFVGTEYLKKFYKNSVRDYLTLSNIDEIKFNFDDNKLEIICIPTWSLEKVSCKIDKFHNASSFQEMTVEQVSNYKRILKNILNQKLISLIVYKGWEKNNTLSPHKINNIFENQFKISEYSRIGTEESLIYLTT